MTITDPLQIVTGAAAVYIADYGTAYPAIDAVPAAAWANLGETQDGITITPEGDVTYIRVDQKGAPIKAILPEEGLKVRARFAKGTLENLAYLFGETATDTPAGGGAAGYRSMPLKRTQAVDEWALMVRGASPYLADVYTQWEFSRVCVESISDIEYTKDGNVAFEVVFGVLWDFNAAVGDEMGQVVAEDEAA